MSTKAITLTVVVVLLLTFWAVADANSSTCQAVDKVWGIEEGAPEPDMAKVDVTGVLCTGPDGMFSTAETSLSMQIRSTATGKYAGFVYWQRGDTVKVENENAFQTWRTPFGVKVCMIRAADWVCGPVGKFAVKVRYINGPTQSPILYRKWITSRNVWASGVHFSWTS